MAPSNKRPTDFAAGPFSWRDTSPGEKRCLAQSLRALGWEPRKNRQHSKFTKKGRPFARLQDDFQKRTTKKPFFRASRKKNDRKVVFWRLQSKRITKGVFFHAFRKKMVCFSEGSRMDAEGVRFS
jgi:hypothetical protein